MIGKLLNTLHSKIALSLSLTIAFSMGLFQTYTYFSLEEVLHNNLIETSEKRIQRLSSDLALPMSKLNKDWVDALISTEMQDETIHKIIVIANDKLFTSKGEAFENDLKYHPNKFDHNHFSRSKDIIYNQQKIGEIRFYIGTDSIEKRLSDEIQRAIFLTLLITLIMTFVLGIILNRLILIPINTLLNATKEISSGKYSDSPTMHGNDEMNLLFKSIESMKSSIQTRETELNNSIEKLNRFFTVTLDLLCIADMEGNFIRLNNSWKDVLGYPLDEIYRHKFFDLIHPEDMSATFKAVEKLNEKQNVIGFINRYRCKDGSYKWLEWRSVPDGTYIYAAARDITESLMHKKELEKANNTLRVNVLKRTEEITKVNKKLQELDKLKSMFIASMSHELRTPLNSIIGFSSILLQRLSGPLNEKQEDQLRRVKSAGQHLLTLISDVIDISKIEAGRVQASPEQFYLNNLLQDAYGEMEILMKPKMLQFKLDNLPQIELFTDKRRLYQCILNYLSNAIKFTESGEITLGATEEQDKINIWVKDTGIGIANEDKIKLFEAFERLETHLRVQAGGTGLGLYLTKRITENILKGEVWVESEEDRGSTFGLRIPKILQE